MCTGNGFAQVHHSGVGSFERECFKAWSAMTRSLLLEVGPAGEELAGGGGKGESAG
jgi:hypothetical protein